MASQCASPLADWIAGAGINLDPRVHVTQTAHGFGLEAEHAAGLEPILRAHAAAGSARLSSGEEKVKVQSAATSENKGDTANYEDTNKDTTENKDDELTRDENEKEKENETDFRANRVPSLSRETSGEESELEEDERVLATVPCAMVLSPTRIHELAHDDSELQEWLSHGSDRDLDVLHLGLLYLWLRARDSPWRGYFAALPKTVEVPFTYSIKKMEGLDFSAVSLHHAALKKRLEIEKAYERFVRSVPQEAATSAAAAESARAAVSRVSLREWLLAHAWISSRGVMHPLTSETCMIPVVDLCNHSSHRSNARYDVDDIGNFELRLTEPFSVKARHHNGDFADGGHSAGDNGEGHAGEGDASFKRSASNSSIVSLSANAPSSEAHAPSRTSSGESTIPSASSVSSRSSNSSRGSLVVRPETSELLLNYGDRSSAEFLFNYGFVPDDRTTADFEEVFKVFDPCSDEIRQTLGSQCTAQQARADERRHESFITYDALLEFFESAANQVLRIVRLPTRLEPDEKKRYRFHNNFLMALATASQLEFRETGGGQRSLFFSNVELTPTNVFDVVRRVGDPAVLERARELVTKLCVFFNSQVSTVSNDDAVILQLAKSESLLYEGYISSNS